MTAGSSIISSSPSSLSVMNPGQLLPFESVKLIEVVVLFAGGGTINKPMISEAFSLVASIDTTDLARFKPSHISVKDLSEESSNLSTMTMQF
jgi:hypothetical protein